MDYRVTDMHGISISGSFGSLTKIDESKRRTLFSTIRVGDYGFDNTHPAENENPWFGGFWARSINLPQEDSEVAIRQKIWRITDMNYKSVVSKYHDLISKQKMADSVPDFSMDKAYRHEDPPIEDPIGALNQKHWEQRIKEYSGVFLRDKVFTTGEAVLDFVTERKYFVSTEGSRIVQNHITARLILSASILADDGCTIPLEKVYNARRPEDLPSQDSIILACQTLVKDLRELSKAPKAEPYTGPAILSATASGVFFHEIFGHRIEGHRLKSKMDGQTFKAKIGEKVLNKNLSVTSNPMVSDYKGQHLNGYYAYDEQGVPGQKVTVVERGILKDFLMSRQPLHPSSKSNGHGRANADFEPVSRQSNLFITAEKTKSDEQLRKMLIQRCKKLGLEYGYYIDEVSGGFTTTDRYRPNVFNIQPRKVYRVYTDGRPDELVRGVSLIGTPLVMFSGIEAAGDSPGIFNGICGAESGGVPVSTIAPSLLVNRIETQKEPEGNQIKPILPIPGGIKATASHTPKDSIIENAMNDELDRSFKNLKYKDLGKPFFITYAFSKQIEYSGSATLGSIENSSIRKYSSHYVRLMVGDYDLNDENYQDHSTNTNYYTGNIQPPLDQDYWGIRRSFWRMTDQVYKSAGSIYKNKVEALNNLKLPEGFEPIPDFSREEVIQRNILRETTGFDTTGTEEILRRYSGIMLDYIDLVESTVSLNMYQADHYFINTEGSRVQYPADHTTLSVSVQCLSRDFQPLTRTLLYHSRNVNSLPSHESVEKDIRSMIDSLLVLRTSPMTNNRYYGPILFLGSAARETLSSLVLGSANSFRANRPGLFMDQQMNLYYSTMMNGSTPSLNQRVMPRNINITARPHMRYFQGEELTGSFQVDAEGVVPPPELLLVENGILVHQLNGRTPTKEVPHSNGHMRNSPFTGKMVAPGVLDIKLTEGGMNESELKQKLIRLALNENLEHAYILRNMTGQGMPIPLMLYKVDLETGTESLVRIMTIMEFPENSLRQISGFSSNRVVHNTLFGGSTYFNDMMGIGDMSAEGLPISLIIPDAFIMEDINLSPMFSPVSISAPVVPNLLEAEVD